MRAIILAAGHGKRLKPLTDTSPKPLLLVQGKPLIVHHLLRLSKAGIKEVIINLHHLGEKIKDALGNGQQYGVAIQYSEEPVLLETGGCVVKCLPWLEDKPFIVLSSDIYTDFPFESLPKNPKYLAHLVAVDNPPYHPKGDFGLETPEIAAPNPIPYPVFVTFDSPVWYNLGGIGVYHPNLFKNAPSGPFPIWQIIKPAILERQVTGQHYQGMWHNIGTVNDLNQANKIAL